MKQVKLVVMENQFFLHCREIIFSLEKSISTFLNSNKLNQAYLFLLIPLISNEEAVIIYITPEKCFYLLDIPDAIEDFYLTSYNDSQIISPFDEDFSSREAVKSLKSTLEQYQESMGHYYSMYLLTRSHKDNLEKADFYSPLREWLKKEKNLLAICQFHVTARYSLN